MGQIGSSEGGAHRQVKMFKIRQQLIWREEESVCVKWDNFSPFGC